MKQPLSQIHLSAPGMSGRGVRFKVLSAAEVDEIELREYGAADKDAKLVEVRHQIALQSLYLMVQAITEPGVKKGEVVTAKWSPVDVVTLAQKFNEFFNAKDQAALQALYTKKHSVSAAEMTDIFEGEIQVRED